MRIAAGRCARARGLGRGGASSLTDAISFYAYPDTRPALEQLAAAGLKLGVVANWDVSLHDVLERFGLAGAFEAVVTAAAVGAAKPDPRPFEVALSRLGVEAAQCLHVGDDPSTDVAGAEAAGMSALLVDRSGHGGLAGRPDGAGGQARDGDVTPPVARDPSLRVPGNHLLIVAGGVIVSYFAVGAYSSRSSRRMSTSSTRPTAMLLTIALYGSIGAVRALGRPARPATPGARSASSRRPRGPAPSASHSGHGRRARSQ